MFGKIENLNFKLTERKKYDVELCLNQFIHDKDTAQTIVNSIQNGESYSIKVASLGCFHFDVDSMVIRKSDETYFLLFNKKEKRLSNEDLIVIQHFEIELNYIALPGGCTTSTHYFLNYNQQEKYVVDDNCSWNGFYYLKKSLGLIED